MKGYPYRKNKFGKYFDSDQRIMGDEQYHIMFNYIDKDELKKILEHIQKDNSEIERVDHLIQGFYGIIPSARFTKKDPKRKEPDYKKYPRK